MPIATHERRGRGAGCDHDHVERSVQSPDLVEALRPRRRSHVPTRGGEGVELRGEVGVRVDVPLIGVDDSVDLGSGRDEPRRRMPPGELDMTAQRLLVEAPVRLGSLAMGIDPREART
nr:hypothetical protein [Microbacterium sp.]